MVGRLVAWDVAFELTLVLVLIGYIPLCRLACLKVGWSLVWVASIIGRSVLYFADELVIHPLCGRVRVHGC